MQKEQMKTLLSIAVSTATFFAARCESSKSDQQSTTPDAAIVAVSPSAVPTNALIDASINAPADAPELDAQPSASSSTEESTAPTRAFRPWRNAVPTPSISPAPGSPSDPTSATIRSFDHQPLHAGSLSGFAQRTLLSPLGL
jgi:hypothetical protein